jgi:hypothetical protein
MGFFHIYPVYGPQLLTDAIFNYFSYPMMLEGASVHDFSDLAED